MTTYVAADGLRTTQMELSMIFTTVYSAIIIAYIGINIQEYPNRLQNQDQKTE